MTPLIGPDTVWVPLLNGVEAHKLLSQSFGDKQVLIGLAKIIARLAGPGHIQHIGATPYIALGEMDNRHSRRVKILQSTLSAAGITTDIPEDIQTALWAKFLFVRFLGRSGCCDPCPSRSFTQSAPDTRNDYRSHAGNIPTGPVPRHPPTRKHC
jgi:2-dehydropantoate 2-reductase